jgi:hypothetical protein
LPCQHRSVTVGLRNSGFYSSSGIAFMAATTA